MLRLREPEPAFNTTRHRAAQLFVESVVCGFVLGAVTGFGGTIVALMIATRGDRFDLVVVWYGTMYAVIIAGFGATICAFVGLLAGFAGWLLVRLGEPRLGAPAIAWLLPLVGLAVVAPIAVAVAAPGAAWWRVLVPSVALALSVVGASIVVSRYLRRAEWASVH